MLVVNFEGWTQCRFATDPDPTDELRGISGPTFATPDEPDLDGIIRLQNPVAIRYPRHADFGVFVTSTEWQDDATGEISLYTEDALIGATVNLLDGPQYYQRNLIVTEEAFNAPIDPFVLRIRGKEGVMIQRRDLWVISEPELNILDIYTQPEIFKKRSSTAALQSPEVADATGIANYVEYRQERRLELIKIRDKLEQKDPEGNRLKILGLTQRIQSIEKDNTMVGIALAGQQFLGMKSDYNFDINGEYIIEDNQSALSGKIGASQVWPIQFWMGGYDVDTMCNYMRGSLKLPFAREKQN